MNQIKRYVIGVVAMLLAVSLVACGGGAAPDNSNMDYLPPITPPLDVAIKDCLPEADVSVIMGVTMTASDPYEDGTWVVYTSEDTARTVSVSMENATKETYDAMINELDGGTWVEELSECAYWYEDRGEIIDYCNGYSIAVTVTDPFVANTYGLNLAVVKKLRGNLDAS